jgi:hypothetical protein
LIAGENGESLGISDVEFEVTGIHLRVRMNDVTTVRIAAINP